MDVTEREQYRVELERQNARLEKFASLVSHDLRNPLNVAQLRLELLREEVKSDNENAAAIERALNRIETLIDEILTLARQGDPVDQWDAVRMSNIVTDCWDMVETGDGELVITDDIAFEANPERLKRLFENLFRNSIEHGGPDVTVSLGSLSDESGFYVEDDGPGIPAEDQSRIFEAGYSTREKGTGFGLAIVTDIAAAHGWDATVTESANGGARFEIRGVEIIR